MVGRIVSRQPLSHILNQIDHARDELAAYEPRAIDWYTRCVSVANRLVPWLAQEAASLAAHVTEVMNSPTDVRQAAAALVDILQSFPEYQSNSTLRVQVKRLTKSLDYEKLLLSDTGGTVVSKLIERFLIEQSADWTLESNGASDYPDLFLRTDDYSGLPDFRRGKGHVYGAALKGKSKRPVRVPDGLEIKTCKRDFSVDCHHAHVGLHLVAIFTRTHHAFQVTDILVGFLRHALYRITVPASPTTTLKASFNGQHFVSILGKSADA